LLREFFVSKKLNEDPRAVMVREKYYTHIPDPLLEYLVKEKLPSSALAVFLVYWRAGLINGTYCSEIPIETVAHKCYIDTSTVSRAYKLLEKKGLLRRESPGRDASKPFQEAVKVTEVLLPPPVYKALGTYPNRSKGAPRANGEVAHAPTETGAHSFIDDHGSVSKQNASLGTPSPSSEHSAGEKKATDVEVKDLFKGLSFKQRMRLLNEAISKLSPEAQSQYHHAISEGSANWNLDLKGKLSENEREILIHSLKASARSVRQEVPTQRLVTQSRLKLTQTQIAHIRRKISETRRGPQVDLTLREVVWSIEKGSLSKFTTLLATRIALKKIREEQWTRPNKMPPNWMLCDDSVSCRQPGENYRYFQMPSRATTASGFRAYQETRPAAVC